MSFLAPLMLAFGVLIPILVLLYLLKVRRQEFVVGSTYLWQDLLRDIAAHEPWQRFHWSILLILQLLVVGLIVFALGRPFYVAQAQETVHAVLVLDGSASMQATDVEPSRFEAAKQAAKNTVRDLGDGSPATVILALDQPRVLAPSTTDRGLLDRAIDAAEPSYGPADMAQTLSLATALGSGPGGTAGGRVRVYLYSDGAFGELTDFRPEGADIRLVPIGTDGENAGITALSARPDPQNTTRFQVFARVRNYGATPVRTTLAINVDGVLVESRDVALDADGSQEFVFTDLPLGGRGVEARLAALDRFELDNVAYTTLDIGRTSQILLVTDGNLFLEKVLSLLPTDEVSRVAPRRYFAIDQDRYDVVVFDGFLPEQWPRGNVLVFNPPESALLTLQGEVRRPRVRDWERDDPIMTFVDLRDVAIARTQKIDPPGWARVLIQGEEAPLLLAGERDGQRIVVVPFDLRQSNLPLSAAFPILMANMLGYLEPAGQAALRDLRPGDAVTLAPLPQTEELAVRLPSGPSRTFQPAGRPITFAETTTPGLYTVAQRAAGQTLLEEPFAINASDEAESNIRPRSVSLGDGRALQAAEPARLVPINREFWMWLVVPALGLLMLEWFWFHRRS
ncbi:MAG: BatA domain-containing protein [Chloroflexota bacterium]|nr:BatA domain-containing protein [Chloroflexota bacterium]